MKLFVSCAGSYCEQITIDRVSNNPAAISFRSDLNLCVNAKCRKKSQCLVRGQCTNKCADTLAAHGVDIVKYQYNT